MSELNHSVFQRCPHDSENPYAQISRELIRDASLSLEARALVIYFLSHSNNWNISIPFVMKSQKISKNKMYRIINEIIESGYVKREEYLQSGKKRFKYYVSEKPKFKKSLLCPQNQDTEKQYPENEDTKKEQSSSYEEEKKEQYKEMSEAKASVPSLEASGLADDLLTSIKSYKENFKPPNLKKWAIEIDKMISKDKIQPETIREVIKWLPSNDFWRKNILSAEKLRIQFDRLELEKEGTKTEDWIRKNRKSASDWKQEFPERLKRMVFRGDYVINSYNSKEISLKMNPESFKRALAHIFGGRYVED